MENLFVVMVQLVHSDKMQGKTVDLDDKVVQSDRR
jgi:hypothetical protein